MIPAIKAYQWLAWAGFMFSILPRIYTNYFVFAGLLLGLLRKAGYPKFNTEYL